MGINNDGVYNILGTSIVNLFLDSDVSWKSYQEDYPGNCFSGDRGLYKRKHNPFISFNSIRNNMTLCRNIVNSNYFASDLLNGVIPNYSFYTPNMNNDGHDTSIEYAGKWLDSFLTPNLPSLLQNRTLTVITWDEDDFTVINKIYTVLIGSMITPGSTDNTFYNHYSLLRMIEDNWGTGNLGRNDASATPINLSSH